MTQPHQPPPSMDDTPFARNLRAFLNGHCAENNSNTPDFVLAAYLIDCLNAYNGAVLARALWYGRIDVPGQGSIPFPEPSDDSPRTVEATP